MRGQNQKLSLQDFATFPQDWTRDVTTIDSSSSKNRGERYNMNLRKQNNRLSPVINITELASSKLTLNLYFRYRLVTLSPNSLLTAEHACF